MTHTPPTEGCGSTPICLNDAHAWQQPSTYAALTVSSDHTSRNIRQIVFTAVFERTFLHHTTFPLSARLQPAQDALSCIVIETLKASGAVTIEVQELHPAEDAVRARFEERIGYFEPEIQADLRMELERLLSIALVVTPAPYTDVTNDELLAWLHHRASCVYRGGNNVLELSDEFAEAVQEEHEALIGRTQGAETRSEDELRAITLLKIAQAQSAMQHKLDAWKAVIVAERLDRVIRRVEYHVQQLFSRRIGELRAELAARHA